MFVQLRVLALKGNEEIIQIKLILYNAIVITTSLTLLRVSTTRYIQNANTYLILEYLEINWSFFKEIHKSLTNVYVNTSHNASKVQNRASGSFVVWLIKTAFAAPRMLYIIITRKIGLGKPGYNAVIGSDSALCVECTNMSGLGLKPISMTKMAFKVTTYLFSLIILLMLTSTYSQGHINCRSNSR